MCCVMPPASPPATLAARMPSSRRSLAVIDVAHDGDDGRARLLRVVGVGLDQLLQLLVGDHLLEAEELHVEAEAAAQLLRHLVVERLVERGEDAALEQERLNVLRADAESSRQTP